MNAETIARVTNVLSNYVDRNNQPVSDDYREDVVNRIDKLISYRFGDQDQDGYRKVEEEAENVVLNDLDDDDLDEIIPKPDPESDKKSTTTKILPSWFKLKTPDLDTSKLDGLKVPAFAAVVLPVIALNLKNSTLATYSLAASLAADLIDLYRSARGAAAVRPRPPPRTPPRVTWWSKFKTMLSNNAKKLLNLLRSLIPTALKNSSFLQKIVLFLQAFKDGAKAYVDFAKKIPELFKLIGQVVKTPFTMLFDKFMLALQYGKYGLSQLYGAIMSQLRAFVQTGRGAWNAFKSSRTMSNLARATQLAISRSPQAIYLAGRISSLTARGSQITSRLKPLLESAKTAYLASKGAVASKLAPAFKTVGRAAGPASLVIEPAFAAWIYSASYGVKDELLKIINQELDNQDYKDAEEAEQYQIARTEVLKQGTGLMEAIRVDQQRKDGEWLYYLGNMVWNGYGLAGGSAAAADMIPDMIGPALKKIQFESHLDAVKTLQRDRTYMRDHLSRALERNDLDLPITQGVVQPALFNAGMKQEQWEKIDAILHENKRYKELVRTIEADRKIAKTLAQSSAANIYNFVPSHHVRKYKMGQGYSRRKEMDKTYYDNLTIRRDLGLPMEGQLEGDQLAAFRAERLKRTTEVADYNREYANREKKWDDTQKRLLKRVDERYIDALSIPDRNTFILNLSSKQLRANASAEYHKCLNDELKKIKSIKKVILPGEDGSGLGVDVGTVKVGNTTTVNDSRVFNNYNEHIKAREYAYTEARYKLSAKYQELAMKKIQQLYKQENGDAEAAVRRLMTFNSSNYIPKSPSDLEAEQTQFMDDLESMERMAIPQDGEYHKARLNYTRKVLEETATYQQRHAGHTMKTMGRVFTYSKNTIEQLKALDSSGMINLKIYNSKTGQVEHFQGVTGSDLPVVNSLGQVQQGGYVTRTIDGVTTKSFMPKGSHAPGWLQTIEMYTDMLAKSIKSGNDRKSDAVKGISTAFQNVMTHINSKHGSSKPTIVTIRDPQPE